MADTRRPAPKVPAETYNNLIHAVGLYPAGSSGIQFRVTVTDVRMRWGHVDVLIRPLQGLGCKWVDSTHVQITP